MRRLALILALIVLATTASAQKRAKLPPLHAGITERVFHPAEPRNWRQAEHKELTVTIWYPAPDTTTETPQVIGAPEAPLFEAGIAAKDAALAPNAPSYPLVLLSHGTGGSAEQLAWLGTALARAGYIVAAVNHPGNNSHEDYTVEGFTLWWERATDVSQVLDGMLADKEFGPRIDKTRIGAAGFSLGGYTALELAGAQTDINEYFNLCTPNAEDRPDMDTTVCHIEETRNMGTPIEMLRKTRKTSAESIARSNKSFEDDRIAAVFAIAPAVGFTLDEDSLHNLNLPVELVVGKLDRIANARDNADYIHAMVHGSRETALPGVNHYTFLDTCTTAGKEQLKTYCADAPSTDRNAVHAQVASMALKFFDRELR
jgi:predicted dienelactone hydrolase